MSKLTAVVKTASQGFVRLVAATNQGMTTGVIYGSVVESDANYLFTKVSIDGLEPNTNYFIAPEIDGVITNYRGRVKTPAANAHSFSFGFASCHSENASPSATIWQNLAQKGASGQMNFFIHLGDIHYRDIAINDVGLFHNGMDHINTGTHLGAFFSSMPVYYMWDDHDYGPNDSDKLSPSRAAALEFFRNAVPVTPYSDDPNDGVYYSFVRGRVRFIVTDLRSERDAKTIPDTINKRTMSQEQENWFKDECLAAQTAGQSIIWANTYPFVAAQDEFNDHWGGYSVYRQHLCDWIIANNLTSRMAIISGDMHALAYDDGSSINNILGIPVCHAAPMGVNNSTKGGPYLVPPITDSQTQYGLMDVTDTGSGDITFRYRGISVSTSSTTETVGIDQTFTLLAD